MILPRITKNVVLYYQLKKKLVGRLPMLAECVVAVGTMLIPLAVVLLVTIDDFPKTWAQSLIVLGAIALITGLIIAIRNEIRASKREKRLDMRDRLRRRIDKSNIIILLHIAEKLGVDMNKVSVTMESKLDKGLEQEIKELENDL